MACVSYGNYDLEVYPGQSRIIQFLQADGTGYPIPTGTQLSGYVISPQPKLVADLSPSIVDAAKGIIRVTLPDTEIVRAVVEQRLFYDVSLRIGTLGKYLPASKFKILFSPTIFMSGIPALTIAPTIPVPTVPATYVIIDQTWVADDGKKYVQTVVAGTDGKPTIQFQEVV